MSHNKLLAFKFYSAVIASYLHHIFSCCAEMALNRKESRQFCTRLSWNWSISRKSLG